MKNKHVECQSCNDTGVNSVGNWCVPCRNFGRNPMKKRIDAALAALYAEPVPPKRADFIEAIEAALRPPVVYAAGWRTAPGELGMFAGPCPSLEELRPSIENGPPTDTIGGRVAWVVRLTTSTDGTLHTTPLARWRDGAWKKKPAKK